MVNLEHQNNLEQYVSDNINLINERISTFKLSSFEAGTDVTYDDTDIKNYLKNKLFDEFEDVKDDLIERFEELGFIKARITDLANEFVFYKPDLHKVLEATIFSELEETHSEEMCESIVNMIFDFTNFSDQKKRFLNRSLKYIVEKSIFMALQNGFQNNINNIESGVMTANAGDSAQFLFVSRAILAGYNCSNVDVRSSRYDAVIDFKGRLYKVQVKGISGNTISFKDRDRGGRGIDYTNERNVGKRITSNDCDIYAAVDKQVGMCYIIPMKEVDPWPDEEITSVSVDRLQQYRENWNIINNLYEEEDI